MNIKRHKFTITLVIFIFLFSNILCEEPEENLIFSDGENDFMKNPQLYAKFDVYLKNNNSGDDCIKKHLQIFNFMTLARQRLFYNAYLYARKNNDIHCFSSEYFKKYFGQTTKSNSKVLS